ncbi:MAG: glycosyltransferase [Gammaproteobacteria bacterium]
MSDPEIPSTTPWDAAQLWFLRFAAGGIVPARWFMKQPPAEAERAARTGFLRLEIVSHCWRYSHLLAYQLSSLVLHPPRRLAVTMTVFHAAEDEGTVALLAKFAAERAPNVTWNWRVLDRGRLFRRGIGRNLAARETAADWVWFTDCDLLFHAGCLDGLADALQGRRDALVFPRREAVTALLEPGDPILERGKSGELPVDIEPQRFVSEPRDRATGPLQIVHGDVAHACGYCADLRVYQKPWPEFAKCTEDRAFRWQLGTQGAPVDVPGVYRIRHASKGRYRDSLWGRLRKAIRRRQSTWRERRRDRSGRFDTSRTPD